MPLNAAHRIMPETSELGGSPGGLAMTVGVGYLRRSTDRQEQSIGDQRVAVERFARERGIRLLRHYIDDGISGTSTAGRRAFQDLIADAERLARLRRSRAVDEHADAFTVVVCYDVKRFGRVDNDEAGYYRHILKRCGVEVLYASEGFTGGGVDDLLRPVKQWQARQESKDLAKVVIRGLVSKATNPRESDQHDQLRVRRGDGEHGAAGVTTSSDSEDSGALPGGGGGGWWMGGAPPYGYDLRYESASGRFIFTVRFERDGTKTLLGEGGESVRELAKGESVAVSKRDRCRLALGDPIRVEVVKRVFRLYVEERKGFKAIATALNTSGAPTARSREWAPHYSGRWSMTSVRAMLLNPAYCGDLAWNRRTDARFYRIAGGRAVEREASSGFGVQSPARRLEDNDESDWIVARDAHAPIVTRRLWEAARDMLGSDRGTPGALSAGLKVVSPGAPAPGGGGGGARRPWAGERTKFLLAGLVRCGRCGNSYEGRIDRPGKPNAEGQRSRSYAYVCGGYIRLGKSVCSRGLAPRDEIEALVIERVLEFHRPFMGGREAKRRLERVMLDSMGAEVSETRAARDRARARLADITAQAGRLLDSLSEDNRVFVDERLRALGKERRELESRVEALDRLALSDRELGETIREEHLFIQGLEAALRGDQPGKRRNALERCVESVTIEAGNPLAIRIAFSRIRGRG